MSRIVVIGSINVDLAVQVGRHPLPGETLMGLGGLRSPGGKGANQALAAALQGSETVLIGNVGDDADAEIALRLLKRAGVDLSGVGVVAQTGLAVITVADSGENTIVVIPGANHEVDGVWAREVVAGLQQNDVVVLQGELPLDVVDVLAEELVTRDIRYILNVAPWGAVAMPALLGADPLVLNEHEADLAHQYVTGTQEVDPREIASKLLDLGCRSVVITLGGEGSLIATSQEIVSIPALKTTVVDSTGAGDAFVGTLAARIIQGDSLEQSARYATRVSAHVVANRGAQTSYPSSADLESKGVE